MSVIRARAHGGETTTAEDLKKLMSITMPAARKLMVKIMSNGELPQPGDLDSAPADEPGLNPTR